MGQSIKISVSSDIPGMVIQNVELEVEPRKLGTSWHALLVDRKNCFNCQLKQIDPETMMIRSTGRNIMTALNEPIRNFLAQYKKKVKIYRVQIVKTNARTRAKLIARRLGLKRERQEEVPSSSPGRATSPPAPAAGRVGMIRRSGERPGVAVGRKKVKLNLPGPSRYPEDALNFAPFAPVGDVEESHLDMQGDDQNASQCSQDSQDPGVDLKSGALERFEKFVGDGDILRINGELENLSRKHKWLKFSRDISHTLTLLQIIFRPQLDH